MIRRPRPAGFTLVELLAVIAIIATLIALLVPAVQNSRETARRTLCVNNVKQLTMAMRAYDDKFDALPGWRNRIVFSTGTNFPSWPVMILPFVERTDVYTTWTTGTGTRFPLELFLCASSPPEVATNPTLAYAGNAGSADNARRWDGVLVDNVIGPRMSIDAVSSADGADTTLLLGEKCIASGTTTFNQGFWSVVGPTVSGSFTFTSGSASVPAFGITMSRPTIVINSGSVGPPGLASQPSSNHPGGAVVSFVGGAPGFLRDSLAPQVYAQLLSSNHVQASGTTPYTTWVTTSTGTYSIPIDADYK